MGHHNGHAYHLDLHDGDQAFDRMVGRSPMADKADRIQRGNRSLRDTVEDPFWRSDKRQDRGMYRTSAAYNSCSDILEMIFLFNIYIK